MKAIIRICALHLTCCEPGKRSNTNSPATCVPQVTIAGAYSKPRVEAQGLFVRELSDKVVGKKGRGFHSYNRVRKETEPRVEESRERLTFSLLSNR